MSRKSSDLDIYKSSYDLLMVITYATKNMRKDFKYILGSKCMDQAIRVLLLINDVNSKVGADAKSVSISDLSSQIEELNLNLRLLSHLNLQKVLQPTLDKLRSHII